MMTVAAIVLTTLVFLYQLSLDPPAHEAFIARYGLIPAQFVVTSVFTSMVVHATWGRFVVNMLYLWIFGDTLEDRLGHGRFVGFYLLCGASAAIAHTAMSAGSAIPIVGASGAVGGVIGGYLSLYPHSRVLTLLPFQPAFVEVRHFLPRCLGRVAVLERTWHAWRACRGEFLRQRRLRGSRHGLCHRNRGEQADAATRPPTRGVVGSVNLAICLSTAILAARQIGR